jgi:hypothetical protein
MPDPPGYGLRDDTHAEHPLLRGKPYPAGFLAMRDDCLISRPAVLSMEAGRPS